MGFQENHCFFHVTIRNYQFMYEVCDFLKVLIYGWKRCLLGGGLRSLSGFAREIVNSSSPRNLRTSGKVREFKDL